MTDLTEQKWKRGEIESPCINLCQIHPAEEICVGCYRTIEEISAWSRLTAERRAELMAELPARAPRLRRRRGGRAARVRNTD